jgi:hypothetical protein
VFHEVEPVELRARCAPRLHKMIKAAADESARSMSAEIAYRLRKSFDREEAGQTRSASKGAGTTVQRPRHSERRDCHGEAPPATRGAA